MAAARNLTDMAQIFVDHTHCGRHVTGLERITLELFSPEALEPLAVTAVRSASRLAMLLKQNFQLPAQTLAAPGSLLLCPGFPPSHLATLLGRRVLPYIHDLFLMTRLQDLNIRARLLMAAPFRHAVKSLPHFLVNSQTTGQELRRFCRPEAKITLYRPQVRNVFGVAPGSRAARTGPADPALLALGTVEPRKNLFAAAAIITALRRQGHAEARLDIVGRPGWGVDMAALGNVPGVILHGYQPQERVKQLIDAADALISTAHDEGLGLPLLEAQYAGLMVIAPDKPVFREVLAGSGLIINAADAGGAAAIIRRAIAAADWRARHASLAQANLLRWNAAALQDKSSVVSLIGRLAGAAVLQPC